MSRIVIFLSWKKVTNRDFFLVVRNGPKQINIPGTEKCFVFYFWHPVLVRPAMKRRFCLKAKNGLIKKGSTAESA